MSYCRFGDDSDVYVFGTGVHWECCGCRLSPMRFSFTLLTMTEVALHLLEHDAVGHKVPDYTWARVLRELVEETTSA